jgi:hypothetical protein
VNEDILLGPERGHVGDMAKGSKGEFST